MADALRDIVRDYCHRSIWRMTTAVLVIDENGFLKQGKGLVRSGGQYNGFRGQITNCQIESSLAYVSSHGHAFIGRALYLPSNGRRSDRWKHELQCLPITGWRPSQSLRRQ